MWTDDLCAAVKVVSVHIDREIGSVHQRGGVWPLQLSSMGLPVAPRINTAAPQAELSPEGETQTSLQFGEFG